MNILAEALVGGLAATVILIVAIVSAIVSVSLGVLLMEIMVPFLSTFSGVALAYLLTILWDRKKAHDAENRLLGDSKAKMKREIEHNLRQASKWLDTTEERRSTIPYLDFLADAKDNAIYTGGYRLLDSELAYEISHVYAVMQRARTLRDLALTNPANRNYVTELVGQLKYFVKRVRGEDPCGPGPLLPRLDRSPTPPTLEKRWCIFGRGVS